MDQSPPLPQNSQARFCGLAAASLVLGMAGFLPLFGRDYFLLWLCLCSIPAIIAGHLARRRIRKSNACLTGSSLAFAGLILGYVTLVVLLNIHDDSGAMMRARRVSSERSAQALEGAVENFHTEYNCLPEVGNQVTTDTGDGVRLLTILLGLEAASGQHQNPRCSRFLAVRETRTKANGLLYQPGGRSVEGLYDSWGNPFTVVLASRNQETLQFSVGAKHYTLNDRRAAVYSPGADKKPGTADDIKSW
ncbi:MAG: DUF4190 domain-containing protein [Verrucomicrobia bacterium]|nr:DUF4190 domain-containing protein [Verrucomicrobiota bacterium]